MCIPLKQYKTAYSLYAQNVNINDIIYFFDGTLFNNGKNGVIITENAFYSRALGENSCFAFDNILNIETKSDYQIFVTDTRGNITTCRLPYNSHYFVPLIWLIVGIKNQSYAPNYAQPNSYNQSLPQNNFLQQPRCYNQPLPQNNFLQQSQGYSQPLPQNHFQQQPQGYNQSFPQNHFQQQPQGYNQSFPQNNFQQQPQGYNQPLQQNNFQQQPQDYYNQPLPQNNSQQSQQNINQPAVQNECQQLSQDNKQSDTQNNDNNPAQPKAEIKTGATLKECCSDDEIKNIQAQLKDVLPTSKNYINQIPSDKISAARKNFAGKINSEDIICVMDFTILGSCKNGAVFTLDEMIFKSENYKYEINYCDIEEVKLNGNLVVRMKDELEYTFRKDDFYYDGTASIIAFQEFLNYMAELVSVHKIIENQVKTNNFNDNLIKIIKKYQHSLTESSVVHIYGSIPQKKLNCAINLYAKNAINNQCYLFTDSTITGNARNGLVMTLWGIYSRDMASNVALYFGDIKNMEADNTHLYAILKNGSKITVSNTVFQENVLCSLINDILSFYNNYCNNPNSYDAETDIKYRDILSSLYTDISQESFEKIDERIKNGDPYATIELGVRYRNGNRCEKNIKKALSLFKSVQSPLAYRYCGEIYFNGEGVEKDTYEAERMFKKAVELGDVSSEVCIANMYFFGINRSIDLSQAFKRYKSIIDEIETSKVPDSAIINLGLCYYFGYGCEKDLHQAHDLLDLVKEKDYYSKYLLAEIYIDCDNYKEHIDEGIMYLNELASYNYPYSLSKLGYIFFIGKPLECNKELAYSYFEKASELNDAVACYYYAIMNLLPDNHNRNLEKAFTFMQKAANDGYPAAQRDLAIMYQYGIGVNKNINTAKEWFDKAAANGDAYSSEWIEHTKEFLKKIKIINAEFSESNPIIDDIDTSSENNNENNTCVWDSTLAEEATGLHRAIYDYPAYVTIDLLKRRGIETRKLKSAEDLINSANVTFSRQFTIGLTNEFPKFFQRQGHGTAFEYANHVDDMLHFKDAKWVGGNNETLGADRIVNGTKIQSKCYSSDNFSNFKKDCFTKDSNGILKSKYEGMDFEVPSDFYDKNIDKIKQLENETGSKIKRSSYTITQCENIAKFGNIDSLVCDAKAGLITASRAVPLSFALSYAISLWNGKDMKASAADAATASIRVLGTAFITSVATSQIMKTSLVKNINISDKLVGNNVQTVLAKAQGSSQSMSKTMAKNAIKSNVVSAVVVTTVLSSADIARIITGRISKEQLFKNVTVTAASVAGGSVGYILGAACGSIVPVVGTFVGGMIGSVIVGGAAGKVANLTMSVFIENDGDKMLEIFNGELQKFAESYFLAEDEIEFVISRIKDKQVLSDSNLRNIYASDNREEYCKKLIEPFINEVCSIRQFIVIPSDEDIEESLHELAEVSEQQLS